LADALPTLVPRPGDAEVVLSNHFVRYALVPDTDQVSRAAEEQALMRHCYTRTYGPDAQHWVLRLDDAGSGAGLRVASAVDAPLLDGLDALLRPGKLTLRSIQPGLMAAFNDCRPQLSGDGWFVLVEPGRLCLARLRGHQWQALKSIKTGAAWLPDLLVLLQRERLLAGADPGDTATARVYVYAPDVPAITPAQAKENGLQLLLTSDTAPASNSALASLAAGTQG
jgi:hypothetical protein